MLSDKEVSMVKKTVEKVTSEAPSKMIVLDFSNANNPTATYTGAGWTGRDVQLALTLVRKGYSRQRYNLVHKKED
jgi:hypothetical protein